jgi:hypothetical protein
MDLRKYARETNFRLAVGAILLLFILGDGLIYLIFGAGPAVFGLICLGAGLVPVLLIIGGLWVMEWVVRRANRE